MNRSTFRTKKKSEVKNPLLYAVGRGMLAGILAAVLLLFLATVITYAQADPLSVAQPASLVALYLAVAVSGFVSAMHSPNPLLSGAICGGFFLLGATALALFPIGNVNSDYSPLVSVLLFFSIPLVSVLASYLSTKRGKRPSSRRKRRR